MRVQLEEVEGEGAVAGAANAARGARRTDRERTVGKVSEYIVVSLAEFSAGVDMCF